MESVGAQMGGAGRGFRGHGGLCGVGHGALFIQRSVMGDADWGWADFLGICKMLNAKNSSLLFVVFGVCFINLIGTCGVCKFLPPYG